MAPRLPTDAQVALLSAVLDALRTHDHIVQRIVVHPTGEIEICLDATAPAQHHNELDRWRAEKRRRKRNADGL
jgi:hypothetical protein